MVRLARVPRRPAPADLALTGALVCWGLLEATLGTGPGSTLTRILFALVVSVPLAVRRQAPLTVAVVIASATLAWVLVADRPESGTFPFPSILLAIFSAALYCKNLGTAVAGGVLPVGAMLVALNTDFNSGTPSVGNLAILVFFCAGTWTAGWLVRRRAAQVREAYAESGELARSAVTEERARIARELHDVVAHSLSIVAVQIGAAEELIETDPGLPAATSSR